MVPDLTTRLAAALTGRYAIERELGQGGMATVYLADDAKHHRKVAIKVLRPELAAILGGERFLKEIEVTANLQHPNILPLYDSGEADSFLYYVMPYVEGESLREKLNREKQLEVEYALEIAKSVASALDYAHRHHVIHRDIKPENVLLHDGQALVADFGIALAVSHAGGTRLTETGLSLGTPHYMSPEQATGDRKLDARSDIYSLASMTYEMLTGDPPHTGNTVQAIIASLVTEEPRPIIARRPTVPPHVATAIHKGLAKLPADRFASAAQFAQALAAPGVGEGAQPTVTPPIRERTGRDWRLASALTAAAVFAVLTGVLALRGWEESVVPAVGRFSVSLPVPLAPSLGRAFAISPDGSRIVFVGRTEDGTQLYSRRLSDMSVDPIPDTEGAAQPFFSPDGQWIGFVARSTLRKVPTSGGPGIDVLRFALTDLAGPHWGDDNSILFTGGGSLYRVAATGGAVDTIRLAEGEQLYWPHVLPGSEAALIRVG